MEEQLRVGELGRAPASTNQACHCGGVAFRPQGNWAFPLLGQGKVARFRGARHALFLRPESPGIYLGIDPHSQVFASGKMDRPARRQRRVHRVV